MDSCGPVGIHPQPKGASVARKRPTASDVQPPALITDRERPPAAWAALTRAEAHAARRSAPLTPDQFKSLRQLAEHGINPLRRM